jgi:hypothetical protein
MSFTSGKNIQPWACPALHEDILCMRHIAFQRMQADNVLFSDGKRAIIYFK